jgi:transcriptional regulator
MHIPEVFRERDVATIHGYIRQIRLGAVISPGPELLVSHIPLIVEPGGPFGVLVGHLDRANPQVEALARGETTLVAFVGPDAYVSPSWYGTSPRVPTWQYVAVHARGRPRLVEEAEGLKALLERQARVFEPAGGSWRMEAVEGYVDRLVGAIVGFEIPIETLECQVRLGQQNNQDDRARVRDALRSGSLQDRRVADLMAPAGPAGDRGA